MRTSSLSRTETELLRRVAAPWTRTSWLYRLVTDVLALKVIRQRRAGSTAARRPPCLGRESRELVGRSVRQATTWSAPVEHCPAIRRRRRTPHRGQAARAAAHTILGLLERISMLRREIGGLQRERQEQRRTALPKLMARHLSERNQAVWKMRVGYWHLVERLKGIEPVPPGPAVAPADPAGNGGDDAAGKGAGIAPGKAANRSGANGNGVVLSSRRPRR